MCGWRNGPDPPLAEEWIITNILQWINALCRLLNFAANNFRNQFCCQLRQRAARRFALNDLHHLFANSADLGGGSVCSLLDLVWPSLGESDREKAKEVVIGGLNSDVGFNERLPFADERS